MMVFMALYLELQAYQDKYGFVQPAEGWSGNGILYTSEAMILLKKWQELTQLQIKRFNETIQTVEIEPGLYNRFPGYDDQEGQDDYIGLTLASNIMGTKHAKDVFNYGRSHGWVFSNKKDNKDKWPARFWRMPQLLAHFYWCAGVEPPLWQKIYWMLVILTTGVFTDGKGQDTWILSWLHIEACPHKEYWSYKFTIKMWQKRLLKFKPNGMKQVFEEYFGKDHPIAKYFTQ